MRKFKLTASLLPLIVAACASGPDYRTPKVAPQMTRAFVTQSPGFDGQAELRDDWWRLYNDRVLDRLIARALTANTDLRVAAANLERAQAVLRASRAGRLPSTTINGGASYGDAIQVDGQGGGTLGSTEQAQWSSFATGSLAWEVDLFGRVGRAIQAARADEEAIAAARDAVRVTVAAETTRAYLNACSAAFTLEVARQSHRSSEESLRLVQAQERAGTVATLDVEQAGATEAAARAAIPDINRQRRFALFELAALLGASPSDVPAEAEACGRPPEPAATIPIGDGASLLRRRPDLRQAERELAADTARIGIATAELYPRIRLGASSNFFRNEDVRGSDSLSFSVGPLLSWNFPNMATARSRLRQAEATGKASLATFDGRVLTALKEVEQALTSVSSEETRLGALRDARDRSEHAYQLADLRFRTGSSAYLDLLVSQTRMLTARADYAASLQRLSSARVDLFKALGGGWM